MSGRKRVHYKVCHHCEKELNIKRFKEHKRLFFNKDTNEWMKDSEDLCGHKDGAESDGSESDFSCFDGNEGIEVVNDAEDGATGWELNLTDSDDNDTSKEHEVSCADYLTVPLKKHKEPQGRY